MSNMKDLQERAIRLAQREERARDAGRALQEREVERKAAVEKTARLRALRLATDQGKPTTPKPKVQKTMQKAKSAK
jgi:hypothetical protein